MSYIKPDCAGLDRSYLRLSLRTSRRRRGNAKVLCDGAHPFRRLLRCIECGFRHHNYTAFEDHEHLERPPRRDLSSFDEPPKGLVTPSALQAALDALPHENGDDERPSAAPPSTSPVLTMADVVKSLADIKVTETTQRDAGTHKLALQSDSGRAGVLVSTVRHRCSLVRRRTSVRISFIW